MSLTIASYSDPYELWAAAEQAPQPTTCEAITKTTGVQCSFHAQGGQRWCAKHWPKEDGPRPKPSFVFSKSQGAQVLYGEVYLPLGEAVMMLTIGGMLPPDSDLHRIRPEDGDFPENLQLVPRVIKEEAVKSRHPEGEPIQWQEKDGVMKYNPTSVRLSIELREFLDKEAARLGWSRQKTLEYYLLEGIKRGKKPVTLTETLKAAG